MRIVRNNEEKGNVFDKHFRELRNSEETPSGDLWDRVEYNLDEERRRKKHDHWYYAALLLLIPLTAVNIYLTYDLKGYYSSLLKEQGTATEQSIIAEGSIWEKLMNQDGNSRGGYNAFEEGANPTPLSPETAPAGINSDQNSQSADLAQTGNTTSLTTLTQVENGDPDGTKDGRSSETGEIAVNNWIPADRLMLETDATPQDVTFTHARSVHERKQSAVKGFHVGIEGGMNNSMILFNENTLSPIVGDNIHRKPDLSPYYAVSMGYDFSRKFGIEAEFIFKSHGGQNFSELRYGKIPIDGEINLEYMHVPVLFKYKMTKMGGKGLNPRVVNFVAGLQYSRLKEAEIKVNDLDLEHVMKPFNRDELGVVLGIEYDLFVHPNYFLTLGTRASISSDIRAFPFFTPGASQTYNVLVGVNASFHYLMKRHK